MTSFDPSAVPFTRGHFVDGAAIGEGRARIPVLRPSDHVGYADVPVADAGMVDRAVQSLRHKTVLIDFAG